MGSIGSFVPFVIVGFIVGFVIVCAIIAIKQRWSDCPAGGAHNDETIETSPIAPFTAKYRCVQCGRQSTGAYGL